MLTLIPDGCDICAGFDDKVDADSDGVPDGCDICAGFDDSADADSDGIPDGCDNCPDDNNPDQADTDNNNIGDICQDGYTPDGPDIQVDLTDSLSITFENVDVAGVTEVSISSQGPPPPTGFKLVPTAPPVYYEITTTAVFSDSIEICFIYDENEIHVPEANLRLFHLHETPPDVTVLPVDVENNQICGRVTSLSPFAMVVFKCGDVNDDWLVNILDVVYIINYIYKEGSEPMPMEAAEIDGIPPINILDVVYLINSIYKEGPEPVCP